MSTLQTVFLEEKSRLQRLYELYMKQLLDLPRGTIQRKVIKNHEYFYLAYRIPGNRKLFFEYIKHDDVALEDLKRKIEKRKYIKSQIKILKKEMNELEKAVKRHE